MPRPSELLVQMMVELAAGKRADSLRELGRWLDTLSGQTDPVTQTIVGGGGAPINASYVTINNTSDLTRERALAAADPINLTDGGANGSVTIGIDADAFDGRYLQLDANNDPLTGDLDIVTDSADAFRVIGTAPQLLATGGWAATATAIYYFSKDFSTTDAPVWSKVVSLPAGAGNIESFASTLDGSEIYIVVQVLTIPGVWYCANPKTASPTWVKIVQSGDNVGGRTVGNGSFAGLIPHGDTVVTNYDWGSGVGYMEITNGTISYTAETTLEGAEFGACMGYRLRCARNYPVQLFYRVDTGDPVGGYKNPGYSSIPWVALNGSTYYGVIEGPFSGDPSYLRNINTGVDVLTLSTSKSFGWGNNFYPRGAYYGTEINFVDSTGKLYRSSDGATFVQPATWAKGCVEQANLSGGGPLAWLKEQVTSGFEMFRVSTNGGSSWSDMTGNFWSVAPALDQLFVDFFLSFSESDIAFAEGGFDAEVFKVDSVTGMSYAERLTIKQTDGLAPLVITSTTVNTNLNADLLDGSHASAFVPVTRTISTTSPLTGGGDLSANRTLAMPAATALADGYLTSADWSTFNAKQPAGAYLTSVTVDAPLTGAGTAASHLSLPAATSLVDGYLTHTDWATFNGKQAAYTILGTLGALANAAGWLHNDGAGVLAYSTPTKTDVGLGNVENTALSTWAGSTSLTTLGTVATGTWQGSAIADSYISSAATWNAKQPAGNYITALTGDVTASGPGSAAATLATVNSNVGSFTNASITVNAKGLITAASSGATPITGTPGTLTVSTANSATSPHTHAITSSSNPGAAASLLASDASGFLQLTRLGIGTAATTTAGLITSHTYTATTGTLTGVNVSTVYNPSGSSSAITRAANFLIQTFTNNNPGTVSGVGCQVQIGTTVATVSGIASGGSFIVSKTGATGTITSAFGGEFYVQSGSTSGGAITNARGGSFGYTGGAGTVAVTNAYGAYIIAGSAGGGTIANLHGLYIEALVAGGTLNRAITTNGGQLSFLHNADSTLATFTGHSTFTAGTTLVQMARNDANTNAVGTVLTLAHNSTGMAAAGFGLKTNYTLESSTTADQTAGYDERLWTDAAHASRTVLYRGTTTGNATQSGFYGAWSFNAISNTAITIIPNGTGDVASVGTFLFSIKDNTAGTTNGGVVVLNPGGGAISLLSDGTDVCQVSCAADGSVTIARSAGTHTFAVSIWGTWQ